MELQVGDIIIIIIMVKYFSSTKEILDQKSPPNMG